jgi:3D (Asp-Asp-Asp) domain-containing protein
MTIINVLMTMFLLLLLPKEIKTGHVDVENVKIGVQPIIEYETVTLTTYSPVSGETDSTPDITASGFKINTKHPERHRIIAVSRDLKKKWKFNTKVRITNGGKYNGIYTVKDVMNKRHKKRIDILVGLKHKPVKLRGIKVHEITTDDE